MGGVAFLVAKWVETAFDLVAGCSIFFDTAVTGACRPWAILAMFMVASCCCLSRMTGVENTSTSPSRIMIDAAICKALELNQFCVDGCCSWAIGLSLPVATEVAGCTIDVRCDCSELKVKSIKPKKASLPIS